MYSLDSHKELMDAVKRMAYMAEYREGGNHGHLERIKGYTQLLGRGLGLTQNEVQLLSTACQLHDIGKIGLAESLLQQDSTPRTTTKIKRHTVIGAEILSNSISPLLQAGETIALSHHERWDGSGYPNGLVGEQIPLSARLCALADVFDALTTPRPYKKEITVEDASRLVIGASSSLFDPQIVQVFIDEFGRILKIKKSIRNSTNNSIGYPGKPITELESQSLRQWLSMACDQVPICYVVETV
jgi:putative two-component system response regulator